MCTHICSKTEDSASLMRIGNRNLELGHTLLVALAEQAG